MRCCLSKPQQSVSPAHLSLIRGRAEPAQVTDTQELSSTESSDAVDSPRIATRQTTLRAVLPLRKATASAGADLRIKSPDDHQLLDCAAGSLFQCTTPPPAMEARPSAPMLNRSQSVPRSSSASKPLAVRSIVFSCEHDESAAASSPGNSKREGATIEREAKIAGTSRLRREVPCPTHSEFSAAKSGDADDRLCQPTLFHWLKQ